MARQTVEFQGLPVGIAVPDGNAIRFIAVKFHVIDLDNRHFSSLVDLQTAIRNHVSGPVNMAA